MEPLDKPINWLFDNCFYKLPFVVKRLKKLGYTVEEYKQMFSYKDNKRKAPTFYRRRLSDKIMVVCMAMTMIELFYLYENVYKNHIFLIGVLCNARQLVLYREKK